MTRGERSGANTSDVANSSRADVAFLCLAVAEGYFEVPRETTLVNLADREGISDVTASERLRRGVRHVVRGSADE